MNNVVGQAVDEFQSAAKQLGVSTKGSSATLSTTASKQSSSNAQHKSAQMASMDSSEQILEILQRAENFPKKQPFRPNLQPIIGSKMPKIGSAKKITTANASSASKSSGGIVVGTGLQAQTTTKIQTGQWQSSGLTEVGKPLKVTAGASTSSAGKMKVKLVR